MHKSIARVYVCASIANGVTVSGACAGSHSMSRDLMSLSGGGLINKAIAKVRLRGLPHLRSLPTPEQKVRGVVEGKLPPKTYDTISKTFQVVSLFTASAILQLIIILAILDSCVKVFKCNSRRKARRRKFLIFFAWVRAVDSSMGGADATQLLGFTLQMSVAVFAILASTTIGIVIYLKTVGIPGFKVSTSLHLTRCPKGLSEGRRPISPYAAAATFSSPAPSPCPSPLCSMATHGGSASSYRPAAAFSAAPEKDEPIKPPTSAS